VEWSTEGLKFGQAFANQIRRRLPCAGGRGSNQGNTQNEKSLYHQSSIDFRCYLEMALFEPRPRDQQ